MDGTANFTIGDAGLARSGSRAPPNLAWGTLVTNKRSLARVDCFGLEIDLALVCLSVPFIRLGSALVGRVLSQLGASFSIGHRAFASLKFQATAPDSEFSAGQGTLAFGLPSEP
ncbi:hypothetical protein OHA21_27465 [Actinoplanes sp. NBC_00393]|uniref:hypothetical protein n=1 Tax=Actinoplanes sp. NBC_00393 TaxID=2975953 RepID=UPI002E1C3460